MWLIELVFFLNSANLICRSTDISKYFKQSLGIRDNESRLYVYTKFYSNYWFEKKNIFPYSKMAANCTEIARAGKVEISSSC